MGKTLAFICFCLALVAMKLQVPFWLSTITALSAIYYGMKIHDRAVRLEVRDRINMLRQRHSLPPSETPGS